MLNAIKKQKQNSQNTEKAVQSNSWQHGRKSWNAYIQILALPLTSYQLLSLSVPQLYHLLNEYN